MICTKTRETFRNIPYFLSEETRNTKLEIPCFGHTSFHRNESEAREVARDVLVYKVPLKTN